MIGPTTNVDLPLALSELTELDIADAVNVPEPPELDAGVLELDAGMLELGIADVAAGDEVPAMVVDPTRLALNADKICDKTSKESGWHSWNGGTWS